VAGAPVDSLRKVPLFADLDERELGQVARLFKERRFAAGETVTKEGLGGAAFFLIDAGEAGVTVGGAARSTLGPGDFFGEIALIDGGPRTASVVATTPVTTLTITRQRFRKMLGEDPSIVLAMLEELAKRLRNNERSPTG